MNECPGIERISMKLISLLLVFYIHTACANAVIFCDAKKGLDLLNRDIYSSAQIEMILTSCDKVSPNKPSVLLLHALFARKNKQNLMAIDWFEKAKALAPDDESIQLELAATYELINQPAKAALFYQQILIKNPQNRLALLGQARVFRLQGEFDKSKAIYQSLLANGSNDVDAYNGLGWIKTAQNDLSAARYFFNETLKIQPQNVEALLALNKIKETELQQAGPTQLCNTDNGLRLLNQANPPITQIKEILKQCALNKINNRDTQLLHGLLARKEALHNQQYGGAIAWLEQAVKSAITNDYGPALELAVTYEWANHPKKALLIYQQILTKEPDNRAALLGLARALRMLKQFDKAQHIYQQLMYKNSKDTDALNGLGWIALAQHDLSKAIQFFRESLNSQPGNKEALLGLKDSEKKPLESELAVKPPSLCDADEGLVLINQKNPPLNKIQAILIRCDRNTPNTTSTLLLHGLVARHLGQQTKDYSNAIAWLIKAMAIAESGNNTPALALAVTYEWAGNFKQSLIVYQWILEKNQNDKAALLGKARSLRFSYQIQPALAIYQQLLQRYPHDIEALSGQGEAYMTNYDFDKARAIFNSVLVADPNNKQVIPDLQRLDQSTKNVLDISGGHYSVPPTASDGLNLYYFRNLNATDGLVVLGSHNTKQIQSGFGAGSALLPNNSLLLGYQQLVPLQYSWLVTYDARQHDGLPFENRLYGSTSLFLKRDLEWFGGLRLAFPDIWDTQLLISGFNVYTPLPVNITVTGFWAFQKIGGYNSTYALDLSKESTDHLFYDMGLSYLVEQSSFEVHGKLIFPVFKNQAFVAEGSHYFFNRSTFITAGWRVYFA